MSSEWIQRKKKYWPHGSLEKFLKFDSSKSVYDALKKRIPRKESDDFSEEFIDDLCHATALGIIRDATRKGYRK